MLGFGAHLTGEMTMESLSEAHLVSQQPYEIHGVMAAELGPYPRAYEFKVRAIANHDKGGDGSWAWLKLFYDGTEVGEQTDNNGGFNQTSLHVDYDFYLSAGSTAQLRIATENQGATLEDHGFEFWWA